MSLLTSYVYCKAWYLSLLIWQKKRGNFQKDQLALILLPDVTALNKGILLFFFFCAESIRQRIFRLIGQAYTSIAAEQFAAYAGLQVDEAIQGSSASSVSVVFIHLTSLI